MKNHHRLALLFIFLAYVGYADLPKHFSVEQAVSEKVLAIWQFGQGAELADGKGAASLRLLGRAQIVPDEVFGQVLECFEYSAGIDKPNGGRVEAKLAPSIEGAFSIEAWVKLKEPEDPKWRGGYILDKMYIPNTHKTKYYNKDYHLRVDRNPSTEKITLRAGIGLGDEVISFNSQSIDSKIGQWQLFAFYYDGAGRGRFFVDGEYIGGQFHEGAGPAAAGIQPIMLGERCGSIHSGLAGYLGEVRLLKGLPSEAKMLGVEMEQQYGRSSFERMEKDQSLRLKIINVLGQNISDLRLFIDDGLQKEQRGLAALSADNELLELELPLRCLGKAGTYSYQVRVQGRSPEGKQVEASSQFEYVLCNRLPEFMPVVMWGGASIEKMLDTGFTHSLIWMDHLDGAVWNADAPLPYSDRYDDTKKNLNKFMAAGLRVLGKMSPGSYLKSQPGYEKDRAELLSVDRKGEAKKIVNFALPRVQRHGFNSARTLANSLSMFPVVDQILFDSEFRDRTDVSFRPEDLAALQKDTGLKEIPAEIERPRGVKYTMLKDFPADRIVPENHPILTYYRWFWGGGDGYPPYLTEAWKGLTFEGKAHWKMLWDPVVRGPSKWGAGGASDIVSHWTYTYPDPLVMGLATDEVRAMSKGGPAHQRIGKMTQVIWYRSQTTGPLPKDKNQWADWEVELPEAKFITIAPDILEIAFWQKISRAICGIYYHGAGSLWDKGKAGGYDYTNPATQPRLAALAKNVVRPYGAMLLKVPERQSDVAMLESFTAQMFYGGMTSGNMIWGTAGRTHGALVRAHLQPEVIYDETILRDGLGQFKVLVMPGCAVLSADVAARIKAWQANGGIIVADDVLAPALEPDVIMDALSQSDVEKQHSLAWAKKLRQELGDLLLPPAEANSSDAILRTRSFGSSDYLFVFNDRREFGNYVGQYKKIMEKGLPLEGVEITVPRADVVVYDLLASSKVASSSAAGKTSFSTSFDPGQGKMYLICASAITQLQLLAPASIKRGESAVLQLMVTDAQGQLLDAVLPVQIEAHNAQGEKLELNGYYAAEAGKLEVKMDIAPNESVGEWQIEVKELASGLTTRRTMLVQ
ncbi:MAG: hypothetical protein PHG44_06875 [Lentisphaeria bacterium]|nr:hypothetical protein [Lentisphaeria bacterium]